MQLASFNESAGAILESAPKGKNAKMASYPRDRSKKRVQVCVLVVISGVTVIKDSKLYRLECRVCSHGGDSAQACHDSVMSSPVPGLARASGPDSDLQMSHRQGGFCHEAGFVLDQGTKPTSVIGP